MKTVAALTALLVASVSAFAPQQQQVSSSSLSVTGFEDTLGAQRPLDFWDPLNLLNGADQERFDKLRFVEIKHGRICMLAIVGHIATAAGKRLPGLEEGKSGLAALKSIPDTVVLQAVLTIGVLELFVMKDISGTSAEYPGDLRNGAFPWSADEATQLQKRGVELNNGRAAMMGILGLMVHEQINGEPYVINALLGFPTK